MSGSVAVTTDQGGTGECETLLRTDDVNDTLALVTQAEICDTEVLDVLLESYTLYTGIVLFDESRNVLDTLSGFGRDILGKRVSLVYS